MAERANGIILDTNVVVAHLRGSVDLQTLASPDEPLFLALIALGELYRGVLKSARPESNRAKVDEFLEIAAVLYPDVATAEIYAQIAQALDTKGTPIPEKDLWIAAVALECDMPLATRDDHLTSRNARYPLVVKEAFKSRGSQVA
jgi:tRNA(fMet)-specific endonuclease VapC